MSLIYYIIFIIIINDYVGKIIHRDFLCSTTRILHYAKDVLEARIYYPYSSTSSYRICCKRHLQNQSFIVYSYYFIVIYLYHGKTVHRKSKAIAKQTTRQSIDQHLNVTKKIHRIPWPSERPCCCLPCWQPPSLLMGGDNRCFPYRLQGGDSSGVLCHFPLATMPGSSARGARRMPMKRPSPSRLWSLRWSWFLKGSAATPSSCS